MARKAARCVSVSLSPQPTTKTPALSRLPAEQAEVELCWTPRQEMHPVCVCCKGWSLCAGDAAAVGQQQGQQQQPGVHAAHMHTHGGLGAVGVLPSIQFEFFCG